MTEPKPLQILDALIGGRWHYLAPDGDESGLSMAHRFSWQVEGYVMVSESVSPNGTSHGTWYWHPTEEKVRMLAVGKALEGISLAEYSEVRKEGDKLVCELTTHDAEGAKRYREEWVFPEADRYDWTLFALSEDGEEEAMQASFERR